MVQFSQMANDMASMTGMASGMADNAALRSQLEAQVGLLSTLTLRTCDTMQRLNDLNMQLARQLADDTFGTCREVLACQDPAQMAAVAMRHLQPSAAHLSNYQQALFGVMADAGASLPSPVASQSGVGAG